MKNLRKIGKGLWLQFQHYKKSGFSIKDRDKTKLLYPFRVFVHPLDAFNDIKYEKKSSLFLANCILFLYFIIRLVEATSTGYLFTDSSEKVNIFMILAQTIGVVLLWSVCNWASCTLFDGEGSMKDIWVMTAYSFMPIVLIEPVAIIISHIASLDEMIILGTIQTIALGWTVLLVFLGMMTAQQFTVTKTILLAVVTILAIIALCFLFLLFFSIAQQMFGFISNIIMELSYR